MAVTSGGLGQRPTRSSANLTPSAMMGSKRAQAVVQVVEEPIKGAIAEYARVPIAFLVETVVDVHETPGSGSLLSERKLRTAYVKDYDRIEHPTTWPIQFDVSKWGLIAALVGEQRVGGAVIAIDTPGVRMLDGRTDLAVLWDIRVSPGMRGKGIGSRLFLAVEQWAVSRNCREVRVETQNTNVTACRFYERQGCMLAVVNRRAYAEMPEEIQLIWHKRLAE